MGKIIKRKCNPAKKVYLKLLSNQLKKYEFDIFDKIDGIATISKMEKIFGTKLPC